MIIFSKRRDLPRRSGQVGPSETHITSHNLPGSTAVMNNWNTSCSHSLNNSYSKMLVLGTVNIGHGPTKKILYLPQRRENKGNIFRCGTFQPLIVARSFI